MSEEPTGFMKFVGGRARMQTWNIPEAEAAEEAINNTMAWCEYFATLELDQDAALKLCLAFSDDDNIDDEPVFKISFDEVLDGALDWAESKEGFDALLDKLQASIDRMRKRSQELGE